MIVLSHGMTKTSQNMKYNRMNDKYIVPCLDNGGCVKQYQRHIIGDAFQQIYSYDTEITIMRSMSWYFAIDISIYNKYAA